MHFLNGWRIINDRAFHFFFIFSTAFFDFGIR